MASTPIQHSRVFGGRSEGLLRIFVGLAGLAAIMLLIALASILSRLTNEAVVAQSPATVSSNAATPVAAATGEPLAELGVAPDAPKTKPAVRPQPPR
jgi:hypothetical protein